jgi:hypothetical protein
MAQLRTCLPGVRGVCLTHFTDGSQRKLPLHLRKRRPCLTAYVGAGKSFRSSRFLLDRLGIPRAYAFALDWRRRNSRVPLHVRTCDTRKRS